jgi:hypothetical protein
VLARTVVQVSVVLSAVYAAAPPSALPNVPDTMDGFSRVDTTGGERYDLVARHERGDTRVDIFVWATGAAGDPAALRSEAAVLIESLRRIFDEFELGDILNRRRTVGRTVLNGVLIVGVARSGAETFPTYAFLYSLPGRRLEIRATGTQPVRRILTLANDLVTDVAQSWIK